MNFRVIEGWGTLPDGWRYVEVAGVAVDAKDNVFCFTRGEHPVIVFDRDGKFLRSWGEGLVRRARAWCAARTASPSTPTAWCG
ncbi:MAG: NHL repeat [Candidatus Rokubacteria bacterium]|nr:NHL repeat [Candidatus Rokubacteria bacterium]